MATGRTKIDAGLLQFIRSRTGATDAAISEAYERSGSFRSLCSDTRLTFRALERWQKSDSEASDRLANEYARLLEDLTEEVRSVLTVTD